MQLFSFFLQMVAMSGGDYVRCPASIEVEQRLLSEPTGWLIKQNEGQQHPLAGVSVFNGPLDRKEKIVPESVMDGRETVSRYFGAISPDDVWIECVYLNTTMKLVRDIGKPIQCISRKKISPIPEVMFECEVARKEQ